MIQIVSAAFIRLDGENLKVLLTQRSEDTTYPLHWCTPGGKVHEGENHQQALERELWEELGLKYIPQIHDQSLLYRHVGTRTKGEPYELFCYWMHFNEYTISPNHAEHCVDARWFSADELDALLLTPADKANIAELKALLHEQGAADREELFQEALSSANALSSRMERILKALNQRKMVAREDTAFLGKIARGLETMLKELFDK